MSLNDAALTSGLSGASRLHDLFVNIEGMTPGEYKNGGEDLQLSYHVSNSPFGALLVASTPKGVCHMSEAVKIINNVFSYLSFLSYFQILDILNTPK